MEGYPAQKEEPFPAWVDSAELPVTPPKAQSCRAGHRGKADPKAWLGDHQQQ